MVVAPAQASVHREGARKRFLMEGMWTRFFLTTARCAFVADGAIGKVVSMTSLASSRSPVQPALLRPELAGGALDVGIYPSLWT